MQPWCMVGDLKRLNLLTFEFPIAFIYVNVTLVNFTTKPRFLSNSQSSKDEKNPRKLDCMKLEGVGMISYFMFETWC